ncbi:secretin N-terminal domain-containing protein [Pelagicoccus sp. SDUM812003]|nr:secretin N-terminal domain-containing protein [Pelagicoccus sp. SDUM812003]
MQLALTTLLCVGGLTYAMAQESVPAERVADGMVEERQAPISVPSTAPSPSDIDRLYGDLTADEIAEREQAAAQNESLNALANEVASPLDQGISLDATDLISVDYPNEEIRTVLRNVADLYSLNLVVPDSLQGTTSIKLRDVTWRQIYSVVLDPVGFTFIEEGSIIKVVSKDSLNFEPPITEIFMINYAEADQIAKTVGNLVEADKGGRVQVDKRSNALIVSERSSKMDDIRSVIERLDRPTQQVFIETRFIEVTDTDVKNIGVNWATLREYGVGAGPFTQTYNRQSSGERGKEYGDEYNTEEADISNQADVKSIGTTRGIFRDNLTGETIMDSTAIGSQRNASAAFNSLRSIANGKSTSAVFSADQFGVVISALKEQGGSRLVSNPTVVTLNNQEANISVGDRYPIPNYAYNEETGRFEVDGFDWEDIGINLKVTPSVNHTGLITLKVVPSVTDLAGVANFGSAEIPILSNRSTVTQIALKDGFTMGIGGLMKNDSSENKNKVPVLGKVPGLGRLFRHESTRETKLNLLIFITAKILPSEEADFEDVFSQEMMMNTGVDPVSLKNR